MQHSISRTMATPGDDSCTARLRRLAPLLALAFLPLLACNVPDEEIGDSEGEPETETETETETDGGSEDDTSTEADGEADGAPEACEAMCDSYERQCSFDACCECVLAGGSFEDLAGFPDDVSDAHNYFCSGVDPFTFETPPCELGACELGAVTILEQLDQPFAPAGVTPQDVLDQIAVPMVAPLDWYQDGILLNTPAPMTTLELAIASTGVVRGVERVWAPPADLPDSPDPCYASVEVEVSIDITTTDGALAESFSSFVTADIDQTDPASIRLHHELPLSGLAGTLELDPEAPGQTLGSDLSLDVDFGQVGAPGGARGGTLVARTSPNDDLTAQSEVLVGKWDLGG